MGGGERAVSIENFEAGHITSAIAAAIDERNFDVIPGLLAALALVDPAAAQRTLDALLGKFTVDLGATP